MDICFTAVAYGDRDHGDGHTKLFVRAYDHEPTEAEVTRDAFVEAVPDWRGRHPDRTPDAMVREWVETLYDAPVLTILHCNFRPKRRGGGLWTWNAARVCVETDHDRRLHLN